MEFQRRQSPCPCVGHHVRLHARNRPGGAKATSNFWKQAFQKLLLNFTWWVNRKDPLRQERLRRRLPRAGQHRRVRPERAVADRAATSNRRTARRGWPCSARTCSNCALNLPRMIRPTKTWSTKFLEHFSLHRCGHEPGPASETACGTKRTGSYYDLLRLPDGRATRLKVRSMVGLLPLCATTVSLEELGSGAGSRRRGCRLRELAHRCLNS